MRRLDEYVGKPTAVRTADRLTQAQMSAGPEILEGDAVGLGQRDEVTQAVPYGRDIGPPAGAGITLVRDHVELDTGPLVDTRKPVDAYLPGLGGALQGEDLVLDVVGDRLSAVRPGQPGAVRAVHEMDRGDRNLETSDELPGLGDSEPAFVGLRPSEGVDCVHPGVACCSDHAGQKAPHNAAHCSLDPQRVAPGRFNNTESRPSGALDRRHSH